MDMLTRIVENMIARTEGPLHFRILLQPLMAIIFAILDGLRDARAGNSPYFWSLLTVPGHRTEMINNGWKSIGKVFIFALLLDAVYQLIVQRFIYAGEMIIVAFLLAIVPYVLFRGIVTRIAARHR